MSFSSKTLLEEDLSVYSLASYDKRMFACILDLFFAFPLWLAVNMPFSHLLEKWLALGFKKPYYALLLTIMFIFVGLYFVLPSYKWGQTIGKKIVGIQLISADRSVKLKMITVAFREFLSLFCLTIPLIFLTYLYKGKKQTLVDVLTHTVIISFKN